MGSSRTGRLTALIVLVTLGLIALFLAQGGTRLVASSFLTAPTVAPTKQSDSDRVQQLAKAAQRRRRDPQPILRRNIFDSETGPLDGSQRVEEPVAEEEATEEAEVVEDNSSGKPAPCEGSFRLVGSVANVRRPALSFASISGASGSPLLYRPGMTVDEHKITEINSQYVVLRPNDGAGARCSLSMFQVEVVATAPSRPTVARAGMMDMGMDAGMMDMEADMEESSMSSRRSNRVSNDEMDANITKVSDTQFSVTRGFVDGLLENQSQLMRSARIIPHQENGQTVGVKLYGIRRSSLLGRLGLQNGDMLRTINGFDMTSPDSALEAYTRLRSADSLSVSIVRRGQPMTMDYNIQ